MCHYHLATNEVILLGQLTLPLPTHHCALLEDQDCIGAGVCSPCLLVFEDELQPTNGSAYSCNVNTVHFPSVSTWEDQGPVNDWGHRKWRCETAQKWPTLSNHQNSQASTSAKLPAGPLPPTPSHHILIMSTFPLFPGDPAGMPSLSSEIKDTDN